MLVIGILLCLFVMYRSFLLDCIIGCLMSQFLFQLLVCWKECVCVLFGMIDELCVKERGKER